MPVTKEQMQVWCEALLAGRDAAPGLELVDYLEAIPRLDTLADVPAGTPVLVRGDVDAKPGAEIGKGDVRLRSMVETLKYGRDKGWKQIIFGHIGRDPKGTLEKVASRLGDLLEQDVPLVKDWLDEATTTISDDVQKQIEAVPDGAVLVLDNTRRYDIERVLWKAKSADLPNLVDGLAKLANQFAEKIATVYVNEALSAGSLDASSTVVPAAMDRVALGKYIASEFDGPMRQCLKTQLV
ncbi:MAG: phosphoglycerate kinase, partial [Planctomycetota bacterium]